MAAPKPAVLGVKRAGSIEPFGSVCELRMVRSVGRKSPVIDYTNLMADAIRISACLEIVAINDSKKPYV